MMTLFVAGVAYESMYQSQSLSCFIVLNVMVGIFRAILDIAFKTLIANNVDEQWRNFTFGLRYAVLNFAAFLGPLVGASYATENSTQLFHLIACGYFFAIFLLLFNESKKKEIQSEVNFPKKLTIVNAFHAINTNSSLKTLFFISFICFCLYSQIASTLAQHIVNEFNNGVDVYSYMLILNALICVFLQIFIVPVLSKINYKTVASIGLSLLAIGFWGLASLKIVL